MELWTQITTATVPPARNSHAMAYDAARGRVVMYSGWGHTPSGYGYLLDTWEFDGVDWCLISTPKVPAVGLGGAMSYDSRRQKVVMFGGYATSGSYTNALYEYDGVNWSGKVLDPSPKRRATCSAYDSARGRFVIFGGINRLRVEDGWPVFEYFNDTWEYDGSSWVQVTTSIAPSARYGHCMAYDESRGRIVLFGGDSTGQTWEYDGTTWRRVTTAHVPHYRSYPSLVYDARRRKVLMFGGVYTEGNVTRYLNDLWEYDGADWHLLSGNAGPSPRVTCAAYDIQNECAVLFGGANAGDSLLGDTWLCTPPVIVAVAVNSDTARRVELPVSVTVRADASRQVLAGVDVFADTVRQKYGSASVAYDTVRSVSSTVGISADTLRRTAIPLVQESSRISAFKSGVGDLNDLRVVTVDLDSPVDSAFRVVADGYKLQDRITYPRVDALVDVWASAEITWDNSAQDVTYRVVAHPSREIAYRIDSQVIAYYEGFVNITASLTCDDPAYNYTFTCGRHVAFFRGQTQKVVVANTMEEIFAQGISDYIASNHLDPAACSVTYSVSSSTPGVEAFLSEDGVNPSASPNAKAWARLGQSNVPYTVEADLGTSAVEKSTQVVSITQDMVASASQVVVVDGHAELAQESPGVYYREGTLNVKPIACPARVQSVTLASLSMTEPVGMAKKADIVWIVDGSGSMGDNQTAIADNAQAFIQSFIDKGADFRVGVVAFCQGSVPINTDGSDGTPGAGSGQWTTDATTFGRMVTSVGTARDNGGTENGMAALRDTLGHYTFRPDANKYFIIVTDEDADDYGTMAQTVSAMLSNGVTVYAVYNPSEPNGYGGSDAPPAQTGGDLYDITAGNWGETLGFLADDIVASLTAVHTYVSNDGVDYASVEAGQTVSFPAGGAELYVRFELRSPQGTITPTVTGFELAYTTDPVTRHVSSGTLSGPYYVTSDLTQLSSNTVQEILADEVAQFAAEIGVPAGLISIENASISGSDDVVETFLSLDGNSSSASALAYPYARRTLAPKRYTGLYEGRAQVSSMSGLVSVSPAHVYELCVLRDDSGVPYPPLNASAPVHLQAGDVPYTVTKTSPWPGQVLFADGSTTTYDNLQGVVGEVYGSVASTEETVHVTYGQEVARPMPAFDIEAPCNYVLEIVSATDNAVACFELPLGVRTVDTGEDAFVSVDDPQSKVIIWIPRLVSLELPWESHHLTYTVSCNGAGPLEEREDGYVPVSIAGLGLIPSVHDIIMHVELLGVYPETVDPVAVECVFDGYGVSVGPISYSEAVAAELQVRVSASYAKAVTSSAPYAVEVYSSPSTVTVYPGEETLVAVLPRPRLPEDMLADPAPVLKAFGVAPGTRFFVRDRDIDTIEVLGTAVSNELAWKPFAHAGYYYFNDEERYFFADPVRLVISPAPSVFVPGLVPTGAPVIVEDPAAPAKAFRHLENMVDGLPSIDVVESVQGTGADRIFVTYGGIHSVEVAGPEGPIADLIVRSNEIARQTGTFAEDETYVVRYRLDRSFVVDWRADGALLTFDRSYNGLLLSYERAQDVKYRPLDGVSFDPTVNPFEGGFLRITDTVYPPKQIKIVVSPSQVEPDGISPVNVVAMLLDSHDNPIEGKELELRSELGDLRATTDQYGCARFVLTVPQNAGVYEIVVACSGIEEKAMLECR